MLKGALRLTASALALTAPLAVAGLAHAADATAAATDANAPVATAAPLTITAERRTVNLQTAPLAASVISGDQVKAKNITELDDLQFHTPSLTVTDFGQGNLFNIRGIGKDLTNVQTPSGVVTYWDGVASFPGFFQDAPYYDISNIEVLRGPQGTFAGQNATGGAVFITTNDPSPHQFGGDLEAQYGSYDDLMLRGFVNMPVSDDLALRVAFDGEKRGTFYKVTGPWTTPWGGAPGRLIEGSFLVSLLWQPTEQFKLVAKGDYNYVDHGGSLADPVTFDFVHLNPSDPFHITNNALNFGTDKFYRLSLNMSYTLPDGIVLRSISGYQYGITNQQIDLDGVSFLPFTFSDYGQERIWSEELNAVSPDKGPLRWVAGLYFQSDVVDLPPNTGFDIFIPGAIPGITDINIIYHTPKDTDAIFGQVTYDFTPQWQIEAGARFTHSRFQLDDINFFNNNPAGPGSHADHASTDDNAVTGKVAINFRPDDNNFLYAFAAEGHKQNGINTDPAIPFGPEDVTDIEVGWKPTFFDGHMRAQIGGYYSLYRHFQLQFLTSNQVSLIQNVTGTTTMYGVEAETQAVFGPLSFEAGGSYQHSRLGSALIFDASPTPGEVNPVQLGGRELPLAPPWTFNVGGQYVFALPDDSTLTPRVDYSYTAGQWATPFQRFGEFLPARNLVNAQLTWARQQWRVTLYSTNVTDLRYILASNVGIPFSLRYAGPPRQYGFRVSRAF